MYANPHRIGRIIGQRVLAAVLLALALLPGVVGSPALARAEAPGGPQTWDKRLHVVLKSAYVSDDHDWGTGEIRLNVRLYRMAPGCAPGSSSTGCRILLAVTTRIPLRADDGDNVLLNRHFPAVGPDASVADASIGPEIGFPVWDDQVYVLEIEGLEEDFGADEELGDATLVLNRGHGWFLGTNVMRAMKSEGTEPGDFSAEVEIREVELPDLRPVDITVSDLPGSVQKRVCAAVQNPGLFDIGAYEMTFQLDGVTLPNGRIPGGSLARGEAKEVCLETTLPTSGQYKITAIADERALMPEITETDNRVEKPFAARPAMPPTGLAQPDLLVAAVKVNGQAPDGKDDCRDGKNTVSVVVKNVGTAAAETFPVWIGVDGTETSIVVRSVSGLEAGREREVRFDGVRLTRGKHELTIGVDQNEAVLETDEENNGRTITVTCQGAG